MEISRIIGLSLFAVIFSIALLGCTQAAGTQNQQAVIGPGTINATPTGAANQNPTTGDVILKETAKNGDTVSVDYVGSLQDGTVFDTSIKAEAQKAGLPLRPSYSPLSFVVGAGQMIKGFDAGVVGMKVGETKTITIPPEEAYGNWSEDNVQSIPTAQLTAMLNQTVKVGMQLSTQGGASGKIISTDANTTRIDFNSALAGKTLVFKITLDKIGS